MRYILAKTLYGEGRGEIRKYGVSPLCAIAHVVMNRAKGDEWYGTTIDQVCLKKWQFSCWNASDPNAALLRDDAKLIADPLFQLCLLAADYCVSGDWKSPVGLANHYHTKAVAPKWSKDKVPDYTIGHHHFFVL